MSKAAKTRARLERLKERRSTRSINRAKYAAQVAAGSNTKKARQDQARRTNYFKHAHKIADCGNIGCLRCSPIAILGKFKLLTQTHGEAAANRFVQPHAF